MTSKAIGHVTLWSKDGHRWETMSFAADDDMQRWLAGDISKYDYEILKRAKELDRRRARRLLGCACATR
jgi:hypothetical protein